MLKNSQTSFGTDLCSPVDTYGRAIKIHDLPDARAAIRPTGVTRPPPPRHLCTRELAKWVMAIRGEGKEDGDRGAEGK